MSIFHCNVCDKSIDSDFRPCELCVMCGELACVTCVTEKDGITLCNRCHDNGSRICADDSCTKVIPDMGGYMCGDCRETICSDHAGMNACGLVQCLTCRKDIPCECRECMKSARNERMESLN